MLKAYMDESGHSVDPRCQFVGMGGLIADEEAWVGFTEEWQRVLDEDIAGEPFHMKEFAMMPGVGPYVGWDEAKRRKFLARLIGCIVGREIRFVGCVVSVDGFNRLMPEHKALFVDPYYLAFQQVTRGCSICGLNIDDPWSPEKVAMMYAYQNTFGAINSGSSDPQQQGRAEQLWHSMQDSDSIHAAAMGSYGSELAKNVQALQAADLFAYELTKEFENRMSRPKDRMRWGLRQLLHRDFRQSLIRFFSYEALLELLMDSSVIAENLDIRLASAMLQLDVKIVMESRTHE